MPWSPKDAINHNKKVGSSKKKDMWSRIANKTLEKTGSDARAIRVANSVIKKMKIREQTE